MFVCRAPSTEAARKGDDAARFCECMRVGLVQRQLSLQLSELSASREAERRSLAAEAERLRDELIHAKARGDCLASQVVSHERLAARSFAFSARCSSREAPSRPRPLRRCKAQPSPLSERLGYRRKCVSAAKAKGKSRLLPNNACKRRKSKC